MWCWRGSLGSTAANDGGVWRTANALAATPTFSRTQATSLGFARGELAINKVGSTVNVVAATGEDSTVARADCANPPMAA